MKDKDKRQNADAEDDIEEEVEEMLRWEDDGGQNGQTSLARELRLVFSTNCP